MVLEEAFSMIWILIVIVALIMGGLVDMFEAIYRYHTSRSAFSLALIFAVIIGLGYFALLYIHLLMVIHP
jgi:hypothetical protein